MKTILTAATAFLAAITLQAQEKNFPCITSISLTFASECGPEAAMFGAGAKPANCGTWCWSGIDILGTGTNCASYNGPYWIFHCDTPSSELFLVATADVHCQDGSHYQYPINAPGNTPGGTIRLAGYCVDLGPRSPDDCGLLVCETVSPPIQQ